MPRERRRGRSCFDRGPFPKILRVAVWVLVAATATAFDGSPSVCHAQHEALQRCANAQMAQHEDGVLTGEELRTRCAREGGAYQRCKKDQEPSAHKSRQQKQARGEDGEIPTVTLDDPTKIFLVIFLMLGWLASAMGWSFSLGDEVTLAQHALPRRAKKQRQKQASTVGSQQREQIHVQDGDDAKRKTD